MIYLTNIAAGDWMIGSESPETLEEQFSVTDKVVITCPIDTPYANHENRCIICNEGDYFDMSSKDCAACKHFNA